jgi:hypothetical protein
MTAPDDVLPPWIADWMEEFCADPDRRAAEEVIYRAAVAVGAPLEELFYSGGSLCEPVEEPEDDELMTAP